MGAVRARRSPFWRYTAFQVPGWVLAGAAGWWAHGALDLPIWAAAGILVFWIVKDMALYPLLRTAYEVNEAPPVERLIGARGVPIEPLAPSGYVRIGNELWQAETTDAARIERDVPVEVVGARGLLLSVRPAAEPDRARSPD